jgi:hypothetical protein
VISEYFIKESFSQYQTLSEMVKNRNNKKKKQFPADKILIFVVAYVKFILFIVTWCI